MPGDRRPPPAGRRACAGQRASTARSATSGPRSPGTRRCRSRRPSGPSGAVVAAQRHRGGQGRHAGDHRAKPGLHRAGRLQARRAPAQGAGRRSTTRSTRTRPRPPAARWCPAAHALESWGDSRAIDGTVSIVQPLIAPIWGGFSEVEVLAAFLGEAREGRARARAQLLAVAVGALRLGARFLRQHLGEVARRRRHPRHRRQARGRRRDRRRGAGARGGSAARSQGRRWQRDRDRVRRRPQGLRRPLRQQCLAAGAAAPDHQAHLGQRRAALADDGGQAGRGHRRHGRDHLPPAHAGGSGA